MSPIEKANELHQNFGIKAIDVVDEILQTLYQFCYTNTWYDDFETNKMVSADHINPDKYWEEVKEILVNDFIN